MGGGSWSDDDHKSRVTTRSSTGSTFKHSATVAAAVSSGKTVTMADAIHADLNIYGKRRESRDSPAHPCSLPIAVIFDETGSMSGNPKIMQDKLPKLMSLLLMKGYVAHPQVLVGAVGDYYSDKAPLQIGQFESDASIDDDTNKIFLENGGGGGMSAGAIGVGGLKMLTGTPHMPYGGVNDGKISLCRESYQNVLYFFANKVDTDAWSKRRQRGYLIIVGDEAAYEFSGRDEIKKIFGDQIEEQGISIKDMLDRCLEQWQIFYLIPKNSSHYDDDSIRAFWVELLGQEQVIKIEDPSAICETIAQIVGLCEGTLAPDLSVMSKDLHDLGSHAVAHVVTTGLKGLADSRALVRTGSGSLPEKSTTSTATRRL